ncbi:MULTISPECIES: biotin-dependent carboxyltransferase family protein [unclassified Leeuwenhoekiella]|uniref:5-oxoprolinase subunit C family protein n=1 Tax=unclassified Leeuwenhoekiella TaxID=2615029 RepID=UPI000C63CAD0|nr:MULTISPECIES: biotin-dependent carboxyltransferase family protein [unclassified Leeuwenhoekiella]MAW94509.1 allophanate hydrolase [Leeuwenhoekiella sp.]MBA81932.1 allophanate hydrolase [Leeuwenhoekiella sp.]|tara:strand:+ start:185 stop:1039 length:855 start_codon:yes stop_codon:yes gene_type:complete
MSQVQVIKPGFYTSIQDLGRLQSACYGVPQSGAMDRLSAQKANLLLNNAEDAAVLEITMTGPELLFEAACQIAICGAHFEVVLNDSPLERSKAYTVASGSRLRFGGLKEGFRAYLAVSGGFLTEQVLKSRSQYAGITQKARLEKGDVLPYSASETRKSSTARVNFQDSGLFHSKIEVFKGPEFELLEEPLQQALFSKDFSIAPTSNRMATGFNELLPNTLKGIVTAPVIPGTVQLTPNGNLIALMRDCQVTGGYPRVLQLSEKGISALAQKRPGEEVGFELEGE